MIRLDIGGGLSAGAAILVIILFFMPWVTVSCSGYSETYTGYRMAVGDEELANQVSEAESEADGDYALLVIPFVALGMVAVALKGFLTGNYGRGEAVSALFAGVIGIFILYLKYLAIEDSATTNSLTVEYEAAFWLTGAALGAIIIGGIITLIQSTQRDNYRTPPSPYYSPPPDRPW